MNYAVVETAGRQFLLQEGSPQRLPGTLGEKGKDVSFDKVLLKKKKGLEIGTPYLRSPVKALILRTGKEKKLIVFKYKPKTGTSRRQGHRNTYTDVLIEL